MIPIKYPGYISIDDCPFELLENSCHYYEHRDILFTCFISEDISVMNRDLSALDVFKIVNVINSTAIKNFAIEIGYTGPIQAFFDDEDCVFDIVFKDGFMSWNLMNSVFDGIVPLRKPSFTGLYGIDDKNPLPPGDWIIKPAVSITDEAGMPIYVRATTEQIKHYKANTIVRSEA